MPWDPPLQTGESYSKAMMRLLASLFADTGLVFVEPYLLRPLAADFFKKEITECAKLQQALAQTTERLQESGEEVPIGLGEVTNLFLKAADGRRVKIRFHEGSFYVGDQLYGEADLLDMIDKDPSRISCNVAARVAMQNALFPVLAYVAGPTEIAYHRQLVDYHLAHGITMPSIVPRLSATMISPEAAAAFDQLHLHPWDPIPTRLKDDTPSQTLHMLRNLCYPRQRPQERVLNWLGFQAKAHDNLIHALLAQVDWRTRGYHYCFFE